MKMNTKYFGEITIEDNKIITFDDGLLGFEENHRFAMINNYDTEEPVPFMWLQSIEDSDLAFVVTIPFFAKADYAFDIPDEVVDHLSIKEEKEVGVYSIVKILDKMSNATCNLMSPIVINSSNRKGEQITLFDTDFTSQEKFN